jgi:hypothetical protein
LISIRWCVIAALAFAVERTVATLAGAPPAPQGEDRKASLAALTKSAATYQVKLGDKRIAKRNDEPLFRWSKPISEIQDAVLFVWTIDGRPVAAGAFLVTRLGECHEFQSLALEPLRAERGDKTAWEPALPGIQFEIVPGSPAPAEAANRRLIQMTSLAEQFRIEAMKGPPFYPENSVQTLRLLPKPLLRYGDPKRAELDGAIFVFAHDTDPEALLLIENRERGDKTGWEFAMAPMTSWELKGWHQSKSVWSAERRPVAEPTRPYFVAGPFPAKGD